MKELISTVLNYYKDNNLSIPTKVDEYIKNYPKGYSRQVLKSKYNLTCSELLTLLDNGYSKADPKATLKSLCEKLGYTILTDVDQYKYLSKDRVDIKCTLCGFVNNTTLDSLRLSTKGCVKCTSGNLAWNKRKEELSELLLGTYNAILLSEIPSKQTGSITVKHLLCGTEYTSQLVGFVSPNTKLRATCPNCRSSDRRVTNTEGNTFGSQFELDCYNKLKHLNPEIHVNYNKYFSTDRRWVCDFKIGNYWLEVSNFKQDYKDYFANISAKQTLVENNGEYFFFIRSLKELEEIVPLLINIKI